MHLFKLIVILKEFFSDVELQNHVSFFCILASGAVAFAHLEHLCVDGISVMLSRLQDLSAGYFDQGPVHLHIYGSFGDNRGYGEELLYAVLRKYLVIYNLSLYPQCLLMNDNDDANVFNFF